MDTAPTTSQRSTRLPGRGDRNGLPRVLAFVLAVLLCSACGSSVLVGAESPGDPDDAPGRHQPRTVADMADMADMAIEPEIELGDDLGFTPTEATTVTENADGSTSVVGTVEVPTAGGPIAIEDADVVVRPDPVTGQDRIVGGTGRVPFPQIGELAGTVVNHLPMSTIGVAYGHELAHLGAHLVDDRQYLFFHFDGGLDIELPFAGRPGYESLPLDLVVPAGHSATFVLDPTDPYFYLGGPCPQDGADADGSSTPGGDPVGSTSRPGADGSDDGEAIASLEASDLPPGEDCGFGFSLGGNIPAPAVLEASAFSGHVVVDGIVPLHAGIELDGSIVMSFDAGLRTVGWGDVVTSIPLLPELLDIRIPLGNASVELRSDAQRIGVAIEGEVGTSDRIVLPFDIPLTLPNSGDGRFSASFGFVPGPNGEPVPDATSHAEITGAGRLGLAHYGDLIGLELSDLATIESTIRIDGSGARITGSGMLSIHRDLVAGASTMFEAFVSGVDPAATHLAGRSAVQVFGTEVADASLRLDRNGLAVSGRVRAGGADVELAGQVTDRGLELTGTTSVSVAIDGIVDTTGAQARIADAIAEVERLDGEIEATRSAVRAERRDRDEGLIAAVRALDAAQDELDGINDTIRSNNRSIDRLEDRKADEKKRFRNLRLTQQAAQLVTHEARLAGWTAEIVALEASNVTQKGLKTAAEAAVRAARDAVDAAETALNAIPVDTDPRIIALVTTRDAARAALESLRTGADALARGGVVQGVIDVRLGTGGLGGSFAGRFCDSAGTSCVELGSGRVEYRPTPTLCVGLPAAGEQCLALPSI